jgi:FkbM family methyltransferase
VEADGWLAEGAQRNAELNGLGQLTSIHAAVGRRATELRFGVGGEVDDGSGRFGAIVVPAVSIDSLADRYGPPDVVFMDVEGYELEALRGAERTLAGHPDWFVEVHGGEALARFGGSVRDIVREFTERGYRCHAGLDRLGYLPSGALFSDTRFRPLEELPELPDARFFLVALGRR